MPNPNAAPFSGQLSTATFPNKYSVVVPPEAPFYRIGLELTRKDGTPLIEGMDYYLGYYFDELSKAEGDSIYGGIMLLNETEINYKLLATGRENRVPTSAIGKFLVDVDIKDPRNVDWTALMNYAPVISPIDPPKDINEAILRDEIVKALEELRLAIIKQSSDLDAIFDEIRTNIKAVGNRVFTEEYYQHHLVKNAHNVTAENLGALPVLGRAVDATKAYGRTLAEISAVMSTAGVNAKRLAQILGFGGGNLYGRVEVLGQDTLEFKSSDGAQFIRVQGTQYTIGSTNNPLDIVADAGNTNPGLAVELGCGLNTLWVHSGPDVKAPVFNGEYLITPDMVTLYLTSAQIRPVNAYFESTDNVKIYGTGKPATPMRIEVTIPNATETVPGGFAVTDVSTYPGTGFAISQKAVTAIKGMLDNYVSDTFTINGKSFIDNGAHQLLTLTTADFGLDNVNNTAPMDKPVTKAITSALSQKAPVTHTHGFSDLTDVPSASEVTSGLVQLHDATDATNNKAATSRQGFLLDEKIKRIAAATDSMMPEWVGTTITYGDDEVLPPEVIGSYDGYARNNAARGAAVFFQDSKMYVLGNYHNGTPDTRGIFYIRAKFDASGNMLSPRKTSIRYQPAGMVYFPGVTLIEVVCSGPSGLIAKGSDNLYYLVPFKGSIDHKKHLTVCLLTIPKYVDDATAGKDFVFDPVTDKLESSGGDFYIVRTDLVGHSQIPESRFRVGVYKIAADDILSGNAVATQLTLQFANVSGKCADLVKPGLFADAIGTGDMMAYYTPEGKAKWTSWASVALGSTRNIVTNWTGNKLRVSVNCQTAGFDDTVGTQFGWWTYAYDVDVSTSVVSGMPNIFPIKIDADGFYYATGTKITRGPKWAGITTGSLITTRCRFGDKVYSYINNLSIPVVPALAVQQLPVGDFDGFLGSQTDGVTTHQEPVEDSVGSVYVASMSAPLFIPGRKEVWVNHIHNSLCVRAGYDTAGSYRVAGYKGFGPTNDRSVVSWNEYATLASIPLVVTKANSRGVLDGAYFSGPKSAPYLVPYGTVTPEAARLEIVAAEWTKLRDMIANLAQTSLPTDGGFDSLIQAFAAGESRYTLALWVVGTTMPTGPLCVATVLATKEISPGSTTYSSNAYAFQVYPTIAGGKITFPMANARGLGYRLNLGNDISAVVNGRWDSQRNTRPGQAYLLSRDDNNYRLCLENIALVSCKSGEKAVTVALNLTRTAADYRGGIVMCDSKLLYTNPLYEAYCSDLSAIVRLSNGIDPVYLSGYTLSDELITGTTVGVDHVIIAGVQTANDWVLYIPDVVKFKLGTTEYNVAASTIDLRTALPDYRNQTIYLHVSADTATNSASYSVSLARDVTDSKICVGVVVTNADRIISIQVDNIKSLGMVQDLAEHTAIADAHLWSSDREIGRSPWSLLTEKWVNGPAATGMLSAGALDSLATDNKAQKVYTKSVSVDGSYIPFGTSDFVASFMMNGVNTAPAAGETWLQNNGLLWTGLNCEATSWSSTETYRTLRFRTHAPGAMGTTVPMTLEFVTPFTANATVIVRADDVLAAQKSFTGTKLPAINTVTFNAAGSKTVWVTIQIGGPTEEVHAAYPKNIAFMLKSGTDVIYRSNDGVYAAPSADCPDPTENAVENAIMVSFENLPNGNYIPMVSVDGRGIPPIIRCRYIPETKEMEVYVPVVYSVYKKPVRLKQVDVTLLPVI